MTLHCRGRAVGFPRRALVMARVDLTSADPAADACARVDAGADIVAIHDDTVDTDAREAAHRLRAACARLDARIAARSPVDAEQLAPPLIAVATRASLVARAALELGADLVDPLDAPPDAELARLCAGSGAALVLREPLEPRAPGAALAPALRRCVEDAFAAGLTCSAVILAPGTGDSGGCLRLRILASLGCPLLFQPACGDAAQSVGLLVGAILRGATLVGVPGDLVGPTHAAAKTLRALETGGG